MAGEGNRPCPPSTDFARLVYQPTQQLSRNDNPLDFARSFTDFADLSVPHHPFNGVLGGISVSAVELDRLGGSAHAELGRVQLSHCRFLLKGVAVLLEPGGMVDELLGRLDLGRHVGEGKMDTLEAVNRPAEMFARASIAEAFLQPTF